MSCRWRFNCTWSCRWRLDCTWRLILTFMLRHVLLVHLLPSRPLATLLARGHGPDADGVEGVGGHEVQELGLARHGPSASDHLLEALIVDEADAEERHRVARRVLDGFDGCLLLVRACVRLMPFLVAYPASSLRPVYRWVWAYAFRMFFIAVGALSGCPFPLGPVVALLGVAREVPLAALDEAPHCGDQVLHLRHLPTSDRGQHVLELLSAVVAVPGVALPRGLLLIIDDVDAAARIQDDLLGLRQHVISEMLKVAAIGGMPYEVAPQSLGEDSQEI